MGRGVIDLTGKRFGKLKVISRGDDKVLPNGSKVIRWLCECDCGNRLQVIGSNLRRGTSTSCGCQVKHFKNLSGCVFNDLTVLERDVEYMDTQGRNVSAWRCRCVVILLLCLRIRLFQDIRNLVVVDCEETGLQIVKCWVRRLGD